MRHKNIKSLDTNHLISKYKEAALAHGTASYSGDYRIANREYENLIAIIREIIGRGHSAEDAFLALLSDENAFVKIWAATHALAFAPTQGEKALSEASQLPGLAGSTATLTLQEYREGRLQVTLPISD